MNPVPPQRQNLLMWLRFAIEFLQALLNLLSELLDVLGPGPSNLEK